MDNITKILSHYKSEPVGVQANLYRFLSHGALGHTGKIIVQAVDQGFEHGPVRSFGINPDAMDPNYHFQLACDAGLSGYAAPLGWLSAAVDNFVGKIPLILKINSGNSLYSKNNPPSQAITATVDDALRLGCSAIGYTLYPGSDENLILIEEAKEIIAEARSKGLPTILWSYARGGDLSKQGETSLDVISYGAHMACLLGAHIVKVKLPDNYIEMDVHKDIYKKIPHSTLDERVKHVVDCCFNGKRMVIFSGGETKSDDELLLEMSAIKKGGGFGSIIGRNIFQRSQSDAIKILQKMIMTLKGA